MLKRMSVFAVVLSMVAGLIPAVPAAAVPNYVYKPVVTSSNDGFTRGQLSADGRYVLYGMNGAVYVRDLAQNTTTQIIAPNSGQPAGISADGRFVAYTKINSAIMDNDGIRSDPRVELFLLDRQTQQVQQLDRAPGGGLANSSSTGSATISDNGQLVVFRSNATNLVANVSGRCTFFVRNVGTDVTDCVAYTTIGGAADVMNAQLSGNGRFVAFELTQETTGVGAGDYNLQVRDLQTNVYQGVRQAYTGQGDGLSISRDGRYVGFVDFITVGGTFHTHVFRYDTATLTRQYASVSTSGQIASGDSQFPCISANGRYMVYQSYWSTNLLDGAPANELEVYLHDFASGATTRVANAADETKTNGWSDAPSVSQDGSVITFETFATNLSPLEGTVPPSDWRGIYARISQPSVTPDAPTGLTAVSPTNSAPQLSWDASAGADSYTIYRDGTAAGSSTVPGFTDTAAAEGTHSYYVTAVNPGGESGPSGAVSVMLDKAAPVLGMPVWSANPLQQGATTTMSVTATDALSGVAQVQYSVENGPLQPMTYNAGAGTWQATLGAGLAANSYSVEVTAADAAGNGSGTTDVLAVYSPANGYVTGHAKILPAASDTMPIARDTSNNPAQLVVGFTNVTAPTSGSFDVSYVVKNNKDEFGLSSSLINWVVVQDSTHASILGRANLTVYMNGAQTVTQNVSVRFDVVLGTGGAPDHMDIKIYSPGANPNTAQPLYVISDIVNTNGSNLMIHP